MAQRSLHKLTTVIMAHIAWLPSCAVLVAIPCVLHAAQFDVIVPGSKQTALITVEGKLELDDEKKFIDVALKHSDATVVFRSNGGNLIAGIEIGKAIWLKGFSTLVPNDTHCASACALAWLGGRVRAMSESARIGFHAASNADTGEVTSVGNAVIGAYLNQLGMPTSAIVYITEPAPDQIKWLTFADAQKYGIDVQRFELEDVASPPRNENAHRLPSVSAPATQVARARDFIIEYFVNSGQSNDRALFYLNTAYADNVIYYKKPTDIRKLLSDKRSFFKRWPSRKYELNISDIDVRCAEIVCKIHGTIVWHMYSSERKSSSDGLAEIDYTISFTTGKPLIVSEWSKVLSRDVKSHEGASTQKSDTNIILRINNGACTYSKIGDEPVRCSSRLLYAILPSSGRGAYSIEVTRMDGTRMLIWMSGGKDYQPTLSEYNLYIDTLRVTIGSKISTFSVEGLCQDKLNDAGTYAFSTRCRAKTRAGTVFGFDLGPGVISKP